MIFFVFFETDGDFGRFRQSYGFTTPAARTAWITEQLALLARREDDELSDLEEWEAAQSEWPHIRILV